MAEKAEQESGGHFGRPSLYSPEFCERVIELGKQGKTPLQMAVALGVARTTMLGWCDDHPDFSTALTRARELSQDWWETAGQQGMLTPGFNASVYNKIISCRFREDYTDTSKQELSGPGGAALPVPTFIIQPVKAKGE